MTINQYGMGNRRIIETVYSLELLYILYIVIIYDIYIIETSFLIYFYVKFILIATRTHGQTMTIHAPSRLMCLQGKYRVDFRSIFKCGPNVSCTY